MDGIWMIAYINILNMFTLNISKFEHNFKV